MTDVTLLDGSIGQELVRLTEDRATPLWSTQVMIDHPQLVRDVHDSYFQVGATVATSNTYAVLRDRLERVGMAEQLPVLVDTAMSAAKAARDAHGGGRIAGSLGPLGASYRPDLTPEPADAARQWAEPVLAMRDHVDVFLIETVSSVKHAEGSLLATKGQGKPVWLALSVKDDDGTLLRSGEPLADVRPLLERYEVDAVLINCSPPEVIGDALDILATFGKPFGAYGNGFTKISDGFLQDFPTVDALTPRTDLNPDRYAEFAMTWVEQGATIVGGCCEVGPEHIAELARRLRAAGHTLV